MRTTLPCIFGLTPNSQIRTGLRRDLDDITRVLSKMIDEQHRV